MRSYDAIRGDVGVPALRRSSGRGGALLGLPSLIDHLFDLPALPDIAGRGRRVLRQGPLAIAADGPRAPGVLGGGPAVDRATDLIRNRGGDPHRVDRWGKRRFAYELNHRWDGYYVLVEAKDRKPAP